MIAGHTFSGFDGRCTCGRRFSDISMFTHDSDAGKPDIAHSGLSNIAEINEIRGENQRIWNAMMAAVDQGGGGDSPW